MPVAGVCLLLERLAHHIVGVHLVFIRSVNFARHNCEIRYPFLKDSHKEVGINKRLRRNRI